MDPPLVRNVPVFDYLFICALCARGSPFRHEARHGHEDAGATHLVHAWSYGEVAYIISVEARCALLLSAMHRVWLR